MRSLIKGLNIGKNSKKQILDILKEIDRNINIIFRDNEYIKNGFYSDYRRVTRDGSLVGYIMICSKIIKSMPAGGIMRGRLYSKTLKLTEMLFKVVGDSRFKTLEKNLRETMKKKVSIDPERVLMEIRASRLVKGEGSICGLTIKNRNPIKLSINVKEIKSQSAEITVSGGEFNLRPGESGESQILIIPHVSGKIILDVDLQLKHEDMESKLEHHFEVPVLEKAPEPEISESPHETGVKVQIQTSSVVNIDIGHLIKRGRPDEWLKLIEELVDKEEKIDLSAHSQGGLSTYEERGYRNLLLSALIVNQSQIYPKEVLSAIKGDSFTSRNLELLMDLIRKKKLSMEPASSDAGYIREGLNIIAGNYELSPTEKKKIKEWSINLPERGNIKVKRSVLKDDTGRAKKIIFQIEE